MSIINVNSTTGLNAALKTAHAGDTIELASGVYTREIVSNVHFTSPVTITSADTNKPAKIAFLGVANSSGLTFSNLEITGSADNYAQARISNSQNLNFVHVTVHGDMTAAPYTQLNGFYILGCSTVNISHSDFEAVNSGIVVARTSGLSITDSAFHNLSKGGVELAQTNNVTITGNNFSDFHTMSNGHGDAVQFLTYGTTSASSNINISDNLIDRGSGVPLQGIFMRDEAKNMPFNNVTIDNNTIIGGEWNAIALTHATGKVQIEGNAIGSWAGANVVAGGSTTFMSWIDLGDLSGAALTETGNNAQAYINGGVRTSPTGNTTMAAITDEGASLMHTWAAQNMGLLSDLSASQVTLLGMAGVHSTVGMI
jgi:hypothetical protein